MGPGCNDTMHKPHLEEGFRRAGGGKSLKNFDFAPYVTCVMGPDLEKCRAPIRANLALYIGGMGARGQKFYNNHITNFRYEGFAPQRHNPFLSRHKNQGAATAS